MIKTFRGVLGDGEQDRIRLQTIKGKVGYKIVKFQLFPLKPGYDNSEYVSKIYKTSTGTADATCNFTDSDLLGAGYINNHTGASYYNLAVVIVFDNEIFNQDIYVTMNDGEGGDNSCNYYIELEVIPLDDAGAEYTTLKDMRQS